MLKPPKTTFIQRGGHWVVAQFVVLAAWLVLAPMRGRFARSRLARAASAVLIGIGVAVGIAGVKRLGAARTPFPAPREEAPLVTSGIYAWVRHPLYTSLICLGAGWAWLWRSKPAAALALTQALLLDAKARREEDFLSRKFAGYGEYARRVRRFVPWLY